MDDLFMQIANYGFPMVVCVYLLIRVESKIETLANSIQTLAISIEKVK